MTRKLVTNEEAIKCLTVELGLRSDGYMSYLAHYGKQDKAEEEFLDSLQTAIAALREQPRWIPVEERLPEDDLPHDTDRVAIKVLTVTKHGTRRFVRELTRQRWWRKGVMQPWRWSKDARGVTHWMPLPSQPEVEEV